MTQRSARNLMTESPPSYDHLLPSDRGSEVSPHFLCPYTEHTNWLGLRDDVIAYHALSHHRGMGCLRVMVPVQTLWELRQRTTWVWAAARQISKWTYNNTCRFIPELVLIHLKSAYMWHTHCIYYLFSLCSDWRWWCSIQRRLNLQYRSTNLLQWFWDRLIDIVYKGPHMHIEYWATLVTEHVYNTLHFLSLPIVIA